MIGTAVAMLASARMLHSMPSLGTAQARCRPDEPGPAVVVTVLGLKDRRGWLKVEAYPADDDDFLADDNVLLSSGKVFRRVEEPVPVDTPVSVCIRLPAPGVYSLAVLHDRDMNHKFGLRSDGIGFPGNPHLGWSKPKAESAEVTVGPSITRIGVLMNYHHGLFSLAPLKAQ